MAWTFRRDTSGLIRVDGGEDRKGFTEALNDTITSLSPRGEPPALSTYWIDHALGNLRKPATDGDTIVSGGNATHIYKADQQVRAESIYETFEPEWMDLDTFIEVLTSWKAAITKLMESGSSLATDQSPYQRNPWPDCPSLSVATRHNKASADSQSLR